MNNNFVHLHAHSEFSLLDGYGKIEDIFRTAYEAGHPAHAITDHGTVSSFCTIAKTEKKIRQEHPNFKLIYGVEAYMTGNRHREPEKGERAWHLTLLIQNQVGYQNLLNLTYLANLEGGVPNRRGRVTPRLDWELLAQHHEGLICLSACISGPICERILSDDLTGALRRARWFRRVFRDQFYLEVMPLASHEQQKVNRELLDLGDYLSIPVVASNDCHWLKPEEAYTHEVLCAIQTHAKMSEPKLSMGGKRFALPEPVHWIKSRGEMEEAFARDHGEYISNSQVGEMLDRSLEVADKVQYQFPETETRLPEFQIPNDPEFWEWRNGRRTKDN